MRESTRQKWAGRFMYSPFLQLLVLKPVFGSVVALGFVALLVVGLSLPPFWQTSPEGFAPPIRLSAAQQVRTWWLRREARSATAAGRHSDAVRLWGQSVNSNPGDADLFRGYFQALLQQNPLGPIRSQGRYVTWAQQTPASDSSGPEDLRLPLVAEAHWFLRLTRTNRNDTELVGRVFVKLGHDRLLPKLLRPLGKDLPPDLDFALMKGMFARRDYVGFADRMRVNAEHHAGNPMFELYRAAYEAGMARSGEAPEAKGRLREASKDGAHRLIASRLLLWVCEREPDVAGAQAALGGLIAQGQAALPDHLAFWRALVRAGRGEETARLVVAMSEEPETAADTIELSELCVRIGLRDRATSLLRRSLDLHGLSAPVFIRYASLLAAEQKWFELRELALRIRMQEGRTEAYQSFSQYVEARVAVGEGQTISARDIFARLDTVQYDQPEIALAIAAGLLEVGMVPPAASLLTRIEGELRTDTSFWTTLAHTARLQTNEVLLLRATQRRWELDPVDPVATVEYADALLVQRAEPARALELTGRAVKANPQASSGRIRHAAALAMNGRARESLEILDAIDEGQVDRSDLAAYLLARFEACLKLDRAEAAWTCYDKIQAQPLFPPQRLWLANAVRSLPRRLTATGNR